MATELEEQKAKQAAERKKARLDIAHHYVEAYTTWRDLMNKEEAKAKKEHERLVAEMDAVTARVQRLNQQGIRAWDEFVGATAMPVEGGRVVPFTEKFNSAELWLHMGEDEILHVYPGKANKGWAYCIYSAVNEAGFRTCGVCGRDVRIPERVDIAVIPEDVDVEAVMKTLLAEPDELSEA